jgi:hypothetical protein
MRRRVLLILEDNSERIAAMRAQLAESLPNVDPVSFAEVGAFVEWAEAHLAEVSLISLDHDLDLIMQADGTYRDPGDGRQAAGRLAGRRPACPVIIHTTNAPGAESMCLTLRDAGWTAIRVAPGPELSWVRTDWLPAGRAAIEGGTPTDEGASGIDGNKQPPSRGANDVPLGRALADVGASLFSLYLLVGTVGALRQGGEHWDMILPWSLGFFSLLPMAGLWIATLVWDPRTAPGRKARRYLVGIIVAAIVVDAGTLALAFCKC